MGAWDITISASLVALRAFRTTLRHHGYGHPMMLSGRKAESMTLLREHYCTRAGSTQFGAITHVLTCSDISGFVVSSTIVGYVTADERPEFHAIGHCELEHKR